jgi:endo-1,4-beta-xylanase
MRRREFLATAAAGARLPRHCAPLRDLAAARNITFGAAVTLSDINRNPSYADLVSRECAIITPSLEAKWAATEPQDGTFHFEPLDALVRFAGEHRLQLHMHNLVWAVYLPSWVPSALAQGRGQAVLARHIGAVAGRYRGRVHSWDVINEAVDPRWPSAPEGLCNTPWRRALGPNYVSHAIQEAHAADPTAKLFINDDDLEYDSPDGEQKRNTYLRLIESWLKDGVPLSGFGLEAHIKPWLPIAEKQYRRFLSDLAGFGLTLHVTEFDICDRTLPSGIAARDAAVATITKQYFDVVLDEPALRTVITWGLYDPASWMLHDRAAQRLDGLAPRPLPYDSFLQPKPMRAAIAAAFRAAPHRPA